jgi:hypothetical protein
MKVKAKTKRREGFTAPASIIVVFLSILLSAISSQARELCPVKIAYVSWQLAGLPLTPPQKRGIITPGRKNKEPLPHYLCQPYYQLKKVGALLAVDKSKQQTKKGECLTNKSTPPLIGQKCGIQIPDTSHFHSEIDKSKITEILNAHISETWPDFIELEELALVAALKGTEAEAERAARLRLLERTCDTLGYLERHGLSEDESAELVRQINQSLCEAASDEVKQRKV